MMMKMVMIIWLTQNTLARGASQTIGKGLDLLYDANDNLPAKTLLSPYKYDNDVDDDDDDGDDNDDDDDGDDNNNSNCYDKLAAKTVLALTKVMDPEEVLTRWNKTKFISKNEMRFQKFQDSKTF